MAPKLAKGMDPLGDISSDDDDGSSEGGDAAAPVPAPAASKAKEVDFEALQKAGYKGYVRCAFLQLRLPSALRRATRANTPALVRVSLTPARPRIARSGPSVLYIPEQRPAGEQSWNWCARWLRTCAESAGLSVVVRRGRGTKAGGDAADSAAEREQTRHAVGAGLDEAIAAQLRAVEHANRLKEEARQEAAELRQAARGGGAGVRHTRARADATAPRLPQQRLR